MDGQTIKSYLEAKARLDCDHLLGRHVWVQWPLEQAGPTMFLGKVIDYDAWEGKIQVRYYYRYCQSCLCNCNSRQTRNCLVLMMMKVEKRAVGFLTAARTLKPGLHHLSQVVLAAHHAHLMQQQQHNPLACNPGCCRQRDQLRSQVYTVPQTGGSHVALPCTTLLDSCPCSSHPLLGAKFMHLFALKNPPPDPLLQPFLHSQQLQRPRTQQAHQAQRYYQLLQPMQMIFSLRPGTKQLLQELSSHPGSKLLLKHSFWANCHNSWWRCIRTSL